MYIGRCCGGLGFAGGCETVPGDDTLSLVPPAVDIRDHRRNALALPPSGLARFEGDILDPWRRDLDLQHRGLAWSAHAVAVGREGNRGKGAC